MLCSSLLAQYKPFTPANIHAHNDYEQPIPFWQAYHAGAGSIETDIFLSSNAIKVAHNWKDVANAPTIAQLYLNPLDSVLLQNSNYPFKDSAKVLQWMIDIKTEAKTTLNALIEVLNKYPRIRNSRKIKIVISGNRPAVEEMVAYPGFIYFDGLPNVTYPEKVLPRIAMISDNLRKYTDWNGKGILTAGDQQKIAAVVKNATMMGKPFRFWNAPDTINAWYQLLKAGVGYINTDRPKELAIFLNQLNDRVYKGSNAFNETYKPGYQYDGANKPPKNIILLIGDGMGMAQLYAGYSANGGNLNIFNMRHTGHSKTSSYDSYVTDSAPGSTAFSSGKKTNNRSVGVDHTGMPLPLLPAILKKEKSMPSAVITCGDLTDATPADFYAHQAERSDSKKIVEDLEKSGINWVIGAPNGSVVSELDSLLPSYKVLRTLDNIKQMRFTEKLVVADPTAWKSIQTGRGNWFENALQNVLQQFSVSDNGFFIMAEAAQIDYGGHNNNLPYIVQEVLDFDKVVGRALEFADQNGETLVIVTADHETGGLTLLDGDYKTGMVSGQFATNDHTAVPVPVFAYGPMAHLFTGVYENTEVFHKILQAIGIKTIK